MHVHMIGLLFEWHEQRNLAEKSTKKEQLLPTQSLLLRAS